MILSGKELSDTLKAQMAAEVVTFPARYGRVPSLAVILVGEDPASQTYVRNKARACERIGIDNITVRMSADTPQEELLARIDQLNADPAVDGILVQLPLPRHIDEARVIDAIAREKDVDGFHPGNVAALWLHSRPLTWLDAPAADAGVPGKAGAAGTGCAAEVPEFTVPCTPLGIIRLLKAGGVQIAGKNAVVIGRSNIVGLPVAKLLLNENATVTICHSRTADLPAVTRQADILVVAIGRPKFVTGDMVKEGAVIIDVGINRDPETGALCGDVDFESVAPKASAITPVPGGVGPMTICCLMENTIAAFLRGRK